MIPAAAYGPPPARPTRLTRLHPAIRFGTAVLAVVIAMTAPWPATSGLLAMLSFALRATGLAFGAQLRQLRPWLPMAALALLVHTLTTTAAAPLGHPTWAGLLAGVGALVRLTCTLAAFSLHLRSGSLDDLVAGVGWWLRPLGRLGLPVDDLGLAVAVACGTVPQVIGEGRRLRAVDDLRRHAHTGRRPPPVPRRRFWTSWLDRARLVVPLLESLGRRAETLELALRGRRPNAPTAGAPRAGEWAVLATGFGAAVGLILLRKGH